MTCWQDVLNNRTAFCIFDAFRQSDPHERSSDTWKTSVPWRKRTLPARSHLHRHEMQISLWISDFFSNKSTNVGNLRILKCHVGRAALIRHSSTTTQARSARSQRSASHNPQGVHWSRPWCPFRHRAQLQTCKRKSCEAIHLELYPVLSHLYLCFSMFLPATSFLIAFIYGIYHGWLSSHHKAL